MSYTKQNFQPNDVLHASQLNAMDEQILTVTNEIETLANDWEVVTQTPVSLGTTVNLPQNWSELQAVVKIVSTSAVDYASIFTTRMMITNIGDTPARFTTGWGSTGTLYSNVDVSETSITFANCVVNGSVNSGAKMIVLAKTGGIGDMYTLIGEGITDES